MKKISLILFSLFYFSTVSAQIYIGENVHEGISKRSYSVLSHLPEKDLTKNLELFLRDYGKFTKPERNIYRLAKPNDRSISTDLNRIEIIAKSNKTISKLEFFFLNDANNALSDHELNVNGAESFVNRFINYLNEQVELELIEQNIELAESELKEALRNQSRLRKSIENNLKAQQKLGKQLDASPELMAEAMSERDDINSLLSEDNQNDLDEKSVTKLERTSKKKDREITKIAKRTKKAEKDLIKKEDELEVLRKEMAEIRNLVNAYQKALIDTKSFSNK